MTEKLNRANRILDRACKAVNLDPVAVRVAMVNTIRDKLREANKPALTINPMTSFREEEARQRVRDGLNAMCDSYTR